MSESTRPPMVTHASVSTNISFDKQEIAARLVDYLTQQFGQSPYVKVTKDEAGFLGLEIDYEKLGMGIEKAMTDKIAKNFQDLPVDMVPVKDIFVEGQGEHTALNYRIDKNAIINMLTNPNFKVTSSDTSPIPTTKEELTARSEKIISIRPALNEYTLDADALVACLRGYAMIEAKSSADKEKTIRDICDDPIRFRSMVEKVLPEGVKMGSGKEGVYDFIVPISSLMKMASEAASNLPDGIMKVTSTGEGKDFVKIDMRHAVDHVSALVEQLSAAKSSGKFSFQNTDNGVHISYQNHGMGQGIENILEDMAGLIVKGMGKPSAIVSGSEHDGKGGPDQDGPIR